MNRLLQGPMRSRLSAGGALALAVLCLGGPAPARMAFRTHHEVPAGSGPTAIARIPASNSALVVGSDDGLLLFHAGKERLSRSRRIGSIQFVRSLDAGDLDGDGLPDLVCISGHSAALTVVPGAGPDKFGDEFDVPLESEPSRVKIRPFGKKLGLSAFVLRDAGVVVLVPSGRRRFRQLAVPGVDDALDFDVADFDGDDVPDLVVAEMDHLLLLRGSAAGSFGTPRVVDSGRSARRVLLADVDRDGRPEILLITETEVVLFGIRLPAAAADADHGPIELTPPRRILSSAGISALSTADMDGDGYPDLAVTDSTRGTLTLLLGTGEGRFSPAGSYVTGRSPGEMVLGDFTQDGHVDAAVLNYVGDSITLLPGSDHGFQSSLSLLADARDLVGINVADFDGDDHLDIATISEESGTVTLFTGNGTGRFATRAPVKVGSQPRAAVAGRLRPGRADDLAVADFAADEVVLLRGSSDTGLHPTQRVSVGAGPAAIVAGSLTTPDGVDLAVANQLARTVSILRNDGQGRFEVVEEIAVGTEPGFLLMGDVNRDGRPDLLVGDERADTVVVLAGTSEGFAPPRTDQLGDRARPLVADDFDGDGRVDLVVCDEAADLVQVLPGLEKGGFGSPIPFPAGPHPDRVAAGDFNEDGRPDLAVLHGNDRTVSILINTSGTKDRGTGREQ